MNALLFAVIAVATNMVAEIPTVTVYASRIDVAKDDIPASVQVLGADQMAESGAHDLPELLKKKTSVDVHAVNGNPILASIAMRGFGDNAFGRIKVVLDGEELNNVDMNQPNLTRIPIDSVERIEVISGPSPVLYGDGAVAGVVNVAADTHDYEKSVRITGKAGSQYTFGGNVHAKGGDEGEGVLYRASYDYLHSDGYRKNSAFDMHTANAGVRKNFENGSAVGLKVNYQNAFYELPGSLSYAGWKYDRKSASTPDDWARIWSYGVAADSKIRLAEDQWLYLDGGLSHQYRHAVYAPNSDYEYDYYSYRLSPRYMNECDIGDFGNRLSAGFDIRYDRYHENHMSFGEPVKRYFSRVRYAMFIHDEFFVTDALSLIAGVRVERIGNRWRKYAGLRENCSHDWMGDCELALVYRPVDKLKTYVKGARFHRSPFCDELSYTQDGLFLEPESGVSLDVGFEWEFIDEFSISANGYGMVMEDEIFFDPVLMPRGYNCNSPSKTRRVGMDTGFSWRREKVAEASVRYNAVHADFASGEYHGNDIPHVPNHRVRMEGGFWITDDLMIKGGYTFASSRFVSGDYANMCDSLPAYSLFDAGIHYEPFWAEAWRVSFVVDNIFDRSYCTYAGRGYYYPACGRGFMFIVSCEF